MNRKSDQDSTRTYFRSDRFFSVGDQWYFTTREFGDKGPYESREKAEEALAAFLREHAGRPASAWDVPGANN
jgi:hypothetical protein